MGVVSVKEGIRSVKKLAVVGESDPTSRLNTSGLLERDRSLTLGVVVVDPSSTGRRPLSETWSLSSCESGMISSTRTFFFFGDRDDGRGVLGPGVAALFDTTATLFLGERLSCRSGGGVDGGGVSSLTWLRGSSDNPHNLLFRATRSSSSSPWAVDSILFGSSLEVATCASSTGSIDIALSSTTGEGSKRASTSDSAESGTRFSGPSMARATGIVRVVNESRFMRSG